MKIEYQDIITLDNNKQFIVAGIADYNETKYLYLVDIKNHNNVEIAELELDGCISIIDSNEEELINALYPLFYENSKNDLSFVKISEN